jgi:hypothetical protein
MTVPGSGIYIVWSHSFTLSRDAEMREVLSTWVGVL